MIDVRITGLDEAIADLEASIDEEMREGMLRVAQAVAEDAASNHTYSNRTGALQAATQAGSIKGAASDGEVIAQVVGDTPYGEYVDGRAGFAFLEPAFENVAARVDDELDAALDRAAERAGWR